MVLDKLPLEKGDKYIKAGEVLEEFFRSAWCVGETPRDSRRDAGATKAKRASFGRPLPKIL